jgi:hypothetical protein
VGKKKLESRLNNIVDISNSFWPRFLNQWWEPELQMPDNHAKLVAKSFKNVYVF